MAELSYKSWPDSGAGALSTHHTLTCLGTRVRAARAPEPGSLSQHTPLLALDGHSGERTGSWGQTKWSLGPQASVREMPGCRGPTHTPLSAHIEDDLIYSTRTASKFTFPARRPPEASTCILTLPTPRLRLHMLKPKPQTLPRPPKPAPRTP